MNVRIVKGKAQLTLGVLRCKAPHPRAGSTYTMCNKVICKTNAAGEIAGNFKCLRCDQIIEVQLAE